MSNLTPVTVAYGNGIGPEIMKAVLHVLEAAGSGIDPQTIEIGESVYKKGIPTGIEDKSWDRIFKNKVFLKAPLTTPQGGGFKSVNVTIRKKLGLYANVRPCVSHHPFVPTQHPKMNVVIIRENEEGLYTGIEYRHTQEVVQCLKVISRSGCERIARFAFEYALSHNRKKITCFTKDNIMKRTDGLFRKMFEQVGGDYPQLEKEHWIVDIGAAKLATVPQDFEVLVLPNLYGDILSDVAAQMTGSVGLAGSANIGDEYAMFEAIHGSAPRRGGQNVANPSGLLHGAILMLLHLGKTQQAQNIHNGWLKTLEEGLHTYDIYQSGVSRKKMGTREFAQAVVDRLGQKPTTLKPVSYDFKNPSVLSSSFKPAASRLKTQPDRQNKTLVGMDVFIDEHQLSVKDMVQKVQAVTPEFLSLAGVYCRGLNVWPGALSPILFSDQWRLRFMHKQTQEPVKFSALTELLLALQKQNLDITKTENLYLFNGEPGFSS